MTSDDWRDSYDAWKTREPDEDRFIEKADTPMTIWASEYDEMMKTIEDLRENIESLRKQLEFYRSGGNQS